MQPQAASSSAAAAATAAGIAGVVTLDGISKAVRGPAMRRGGASAEEVQGSASQSKGLFSGSSSVSQPQPQGFGSLSGSFLRMAGENGGAAAGGGVSAAMTSATSTSSVIGIQLPSVSLEKEFAESLNFNLNFGPGIAGIRKASLTEYDGHTQDILQEESAAMAAEAVSEESRITEHGLDVRRDIRVAPSVSISLLSSANIPQAIPERTGGVTGHRKSVTNLSSKMPSGASSSSRHKPAVQRSASLEKFTPMQVTGNMNNSASKRGGGIGGASATSLQRSGSFDNSNSHPVPFNSDPLLNQNQYQNQPLTIGIPLMGRETRNSLKDRVII